MVANVSITLCQLTYRPVLVQPDTLSASEDEWLNATDAMRLQLKYILFITIVKKLAIIKEMW